MLIRFLVMLFVLLRAPHPNPYPYSHRFHEVARGINLGADSLLLGGAGACTDLELRLELCREVCHEKVGKLAALVRG